MGIFSADRELVPVSELLRALRAGEADAAFRALDPAGDAGWQAARAAALAEDFAAAYGRDRPAVLLSVAGRCELIGNHTDHQRGAVLAASVHPDILGVASPRDDGIIRLSGEGFGEDVVDTGAPLVPDEGRFGSSEALVAGVCDGFRRAGLQAGGFDARTTSDVLKGSGLSSSAAFEDMVGLIQSHLYNGGRADVVTVARISRYAENRFFGKPCGLMDQIACAAGGVVAIDFEDPERPLVESVPLDLTAAGYSLCIVDTGGSHAGLTDEYAAVPREMGEVAAVFGRCVLGEVPERDVRRALPTLRERVGDRAVLRALHFYGENRRISEAKQALLEAAAGDGEGRARALDFFLRLVSESGRSSVGYLQNVYATGRPREQGIPLALCLCESVLRGRRAAFRVHGGGFAGTILAILPTEAVRDFSDAMDAVFGRGAARELRIRPVGAVRIL